MNVFLSLFSHHQLLKADSFPLPEPASDRDFFLLKGSFSFSLLPSACSQGIIWLFGAFSFLLKVFILQYKLPWDNCSCDLVLYKSIYIELIILFQVLQDNTWCVSGQASFKWSKAFPFFTLCWNYSECSLVVQQHQHRQLTNSSFFICLKTHRRKKEVLKKVCLVVHMWS